VPKTIVSGQFLFVSIIEDDVALFLRVAVYYVIPLTRVKTTNTTDFKKNLPARRAAV